MNGNGSGSENPVELLISTSSNNFFIADPDLTEFFAIITPSFRLSAFPAINKIAAVLTKHRLSRASSSFELFLPSNTALTTLRLS